MGGKKTSEAIYEPTWVNFLGGMWVGGGGNKQKRWGGKKMEQGGSNRHWPIESPHFDGQTINKNPAGAVR